MGLTKEQEMILTSQSKNLVVSASAGSGKTFVLIEKLINIITEKKVPLSRLLVLTFTKAAAKEMKSRLYNGLLNQKPDPFILEQLDDISISDISTIDSFCEKIIKRNLIKLDIDEGFTILDEHSSWRLKKRAFASAFDRFSKNQEQFDVIYYAFKKNKDRIEECLFDMQGYFDSLADEEKTRTLFLENYQQYLIKAYDFLKNHIFNKLDKAKELLKKAGMFEDIPEKQQGFISSLNKNIKSVDKNAEFFDVCNQINLISLPDLPRTKAEAELKKCLALAKEKIKEAKEVCENYKQITASQREEIDKATLSKAILNLYNLYKEKYQNLKAGRSALDFADIENYAKILLSDEEIKKGLQERYDYIFIDEYQDTNRLQESILKPIAEGGFFTAVGDIKQGIYGFRNANKEIMQEDITSFSAAEDGEALYLRGNFRTDNNILSFVNDVFEKIMTEESVGIDYKKTSMLEGLRKFEKNTLPAVSIDIIDEGEKEKPEPRKGIYSVKEDTLTQDLKYKTELYTIASRIEEVLDSQIYDAKRECFRPACEGDIALLFRGRSSFMKECVKFLQDKGFNVNADIKNSLLEDGQIKVLESLLKISLNPQDDISLASVMASPFGGFSFQELADLRRENPSEEFYKIILSSQNEKIEKFLKMIEKFTFNYQIYGITKAFQKLFNEYDYYKYLKTLSSSREKIVHINEFFKLIRSNDYDFKPMSVVMALEQNTKQKAEDGGSENAITVTTIHATKGLEYPVVILCGCGENLTKVYNKNHIMTQEFGFGMHVYDFSDDSHVLPPTFLASKLKKAEQEFESELMIFYVALTRAQNHLYIIGQGKEKSFSFDELEVQNNYLKLIMFALGQGFVSQLFEEGKIVTENRRINIISGFEEEISEEIKIIKNQKNIKNNEKIQEKIEKYRNFEYENFKNCKLNFKNSVTGILDLEKEEQNNVGFQNGDISREKAILTGNAYHEALKLLDFEKINSLEATKRELEKIKPKMTEEYFPLVDVKLLYDNIVVIKNLLEGQLIFKEKEFLMKSSLKEVGFSNSDEDFVIIQGIVDFFAIGKKNILIDFKYSSANEQTLKERYEKQIQLYTHAIEKAFNKKLDEKYLLSLKNSKLIKF